MPLVRYMNTIGLNSMKRKQFKSTKHQKQALTTKHIGLQPMIPKKEQAHKACTEICTTFLTPLISFGLSKNCRFM